MCAYANRVDEEQAKNIASKFLKREQNEGSTKAEAKSRTKVNTDQLRISYTHCDESGMPLFYVFNNGLNNGFVIVSADDLTLSVLGYSNSGSFDVDSISEITREWLNEYGSQIKTAVSNNNQRKNVSIANDNSHHIPIAPLTRSEWGQNAPFNNDCPTYGNDHYPAGCVPVALGQIMYYYKWPTVTNDNYKIEWNRILADYKGASSNSSRSAVAGLIRHIGINAGTSYAMDGSSTYHNDALDIMVKNYKYNPKCSTKYKYNYSAQDWDNLIYNELSQKKLVLYSAHNSVSGHEFIIDGYEYGYYHVNWGWNGQSNGYFLLSALMDYNSNGCAVVDLYPDGDYSNDDKILKWGYCNDDLLTLKGADKQKGGGVIIPKSELKSYIGQKVIGMEVGLVGDVQDMECFISLGIDNNIISSQWFETGYGGWNRIIFDYPYIIEGEEIFAGYTFWEKLDDVAIATSTRTDTQRMYGLSSGFTFDGEKWSSVSNSHVAVRLLLEGEQLPLDVRLTEVDDAVIEKGGVLFLTGTLENMSSSTISNCIFMYSVDDSDPAECQLDLSLKPNDIGHFSIHTDLEFEDGYHDIRVWVSKVNGQEDAVISNNEYWRTHPAQLKVRGEKFRRRMVVEESTGTWCSWCPRGNVALEKLKNEFPDDFIGIAIHNDDEMSGADNYKTSLSFPSGLINRMAETDMYYSDIKDKLSKYSGYADVDIDSKANYTIKEVGCIEVCSNLTWEAFNPNHIYQLAYVVLEDSVGPYLQNNGAYSDGSLANLGWPYKDEYVLTYFNDVARGIYDSYNGVPNSITGDILPNVKYEYKQSLVLPSSVANKDNVKIVCMIIDVTTGEIKNAVKTSVSNYLGNDDNLILSHKHLEISETEYKQLYAVSRNEYQGMQLEWGTMDEKIATVTQSGLVQGITLGTTTIYVQIKDMPMTRIECVVTVEEVEGTLRRNVTISEAGTLANTLGDDIYKVTHLSIEGPINGDDLATLACMMGSRSDYENLSYLDLSNARIVKGGRYLKYGEYSTLEEDDCLPEGVFDNNYSLRFIAMPSSLIKIEDNALVNSFSIQQIVLNEGLRNIGNWAFAFNWVMSCDGSRGSLKEINIPSTVSSIAPSFLMGCTKVNIVFDNANPYFSYDNIALYSKDFDEFIMVSPLYNGIFTVNENCTFIEVGMLSNNISGLIATNVREIAWSLPESENLEFMALGNPLESLGDYVFYDMPNLTNIYLGCNNIPNGNYSNSEIQFENASNCTLYVPSSSVDIFKADSFWGKMKEIKPIEGTEFEYLKNTEDIILSNKNIVISEKDYKQLTASITSEEYQDMQLEWGSMDEKIAVVSQSGLVEGISLGTTTIYVQIKDMPLTRIECVVTVEELDGTLRRNVTISEAGTLARILGDDIYKVTHLFIDGSINGDDLNTLRFMMGCGENSTSMGSNRNLVYLNLQNARIVEGGNYANEYSLDENDILPQYVFRCSQSLRKFITPKSLKRIEKEALYLSESLEEVILNEGLEKIGKSAFWDNGLRTLHIPSSVELLDPTFLIGCYKLTNLTISDSNPYYTISNHAIYTLDRKELVCPDPSYEGILVLDEQCERIGEYALSFSPLKGVVAENISLVKFAAFNWSQRLEFVAFGANLRKLEYNFNVCHKLHSVYLGCKDIPEWEDEDNYWSGIENWTVYVPESSINEYRNHSFWSKAKAIKPIEGTEFEYLKNTVINDIGKVHSEYKKTDMIYTLDGRLANKISKGIYIINGKKVIVK